MSFILSIYSSLIHTLVEPFQSYSFMRRALIGTMAIALSSAPLGIVLTLRRMSLFGDALSHAVLPGVAIGFLFFGLSLPALSIGGFVAGIVVVGLASLVSRHTSLQEDATMAASYLIALGLGVMMISMSGSRLDLLHILFGNVLGVDRSGLLLIALVCTVTLIAGLACYRGLLLESFDPVFLAASGARNSWYQQLFLMLVVMNLVASYQTLGTLMAVGLMMLPAVSARLWHDSLPKQLVNSIVQAMIAGYCGLLLSYYLGTPSGPTIIVSSGALYVLSLTFSPRGWLMHLARKRHLTG